MCSCEFAESGDDRPPGEFDLEGIGFGGFGRSEFSFGSAEEVVRVDHPFINDYFLGQRGLRALQGMRNMKDPHYGK